MWDGWLSSEPLASIVAAGSGKVCAPDSREHDDDNDHIHPQQHKRSYSPPPQEGQRGRPEYSEWVTIWAPAVIVELEERSSLIAGPG